jgi:excisionase family DNA binding protein
MKQMSVRFSESPTCSIKEACEATALGRSYLYELIVAGKVRKIKLGKKTLIDVPSLLAAVGARQMLDEAAHAAANAAMKASAREMLDRSAA